MYNLSFYYFFCIFWKSGISMREMMACTAGRSEDLHVFRGSSICTTCGMSDAVVHFSSCLGSLKADWIVPKAKHMLQTRRRHTIPQEA
jgi:hypothetical protein